MERKKMKSKKILMLSLVALLALVAVVGFTHAKVLPQGNTATIWASTTSGGAAQLQFSPSTTLYLNYLVQYNNAPGSGLLSLKDMTTNTWVFTNAAVSGSGSYAIVGGLAPGVYQANINGVTVNIAVATIFVLPESVIGALAALGAGLAAFGIFNYKYKKN
jgi:hypothetical protein